MGKKELTFGELVHIEPELQELFNQANAYRVSRGYYRDTVWHKEFKPRLLRLVGFGALTNNETLKSTEAYDLAYSNIFNALPRLRG